MFLETLVLVFFFSISRVHLADCENVCSPGQICSAFYVNHVNLQLSGCPVSSAPSSVAIITALNCLNNLSCVAMICDIGKTSCFPCYADVISGLTFSSAWTGSFLKRRLFKSVFYYDESTRKTTADFEIPNGLLPGDVIFIKGMITRYDNMAINLMEDGNKIIYSLRARCVDFCSDTDTCPPADCESRYLSLSYFQNGAWGLDTSETYPFTKDQVFETYFLIGPSSIEMYVNQKFANSYTTSIPTQFARRIQIGAYVQVFELSI
ncbi:galectin-related protein precursor [Biomphalaria pfeifferi]|uniref:Galectin n=1 Tax=Biomphalaria pfeifferi TaxID=112525 RepID=A0AAD8BWU4_BIOPF|nr:galectin-related protein precursor [Biomphalaria pfeifferi]